MSIKTGLEKETKFEDMVQEVSSLKSAFFEKTFSESKLNLFYFIFCNFILN